MASRAVATGVGVEEKDSSHAAVPEELQQGHLAGHLLHRG